MKHAKSVRSTKLITALMGLILFIDDYANTMLVGSTLRPLTDRQNISREKLAFLVDATSAPVAGVALISTWIGYEVGLFQKTAESLGIATDGYSMFFDALGFRFYCFLMIAFVLINAFTGKDFGPMAEAEKRARGGRGLTEKHAKPITSKGFASAEAHEKARIHAFAAILPVSGLFAALIGGLWLDGGGGDKFAQNPFSFFSLSTWREVFTTSENSIMLLAYAGGFGAWISMICAQWIAKILFKQR